MVQRTSSLIFATAALSAAFVAGTPVHGFGRIGMAGAPHTLSAETRHSLGESAISGAVSLASNAYSAHQQKKMAKKMMAQEQMQPGRRDVEDDLFSFSRRDFEVLDARGPGGKGGKVMKTERGEKGEGSHRRKPHRGMSMHGAVPAGMQGMQSGMQGMQGGMQGGMPGMGSPMQGGQQQQQEAPPMQQQMAGRDIEELYDFEARELEEVEARNFLEKAGAAALRHGVSALTHHGPSLIEGGANFAGQAIQAKSQARMMMMPQAYQPYRREEEEFWTRSYEDFDELD